MAANDEVRMASERFYGALSKMANGDGSGFAAVWESGPDATAMHPIGDREVGWDAVGGSFQQVADLSQGGKVELQNRLVRVVGDVAYEIGVERGRLKLGNEDVEIDQRVTNIYRRENGEWKMVHHHADRSPAMEAVLSRLA